MRCQYNGGMDLSTLRQRGEALAGALAEAKLLEASGRGRADFASIYAEFNDFASPDVVALARELGAGAKDDAAKAGARQLLRFAVAALQGSRVARLLDERNAFEHQADFVFEEEP